MISDEKLTSIFRSMSQAVIITRASDGLIHEVNESFTRLTGYAYDEAVGRSTVALNLWVNDIERKRVITILNKGEKISEAEFLFRTKDGVLCTGLFSCDLISLEGEPFILSSFTDISQRKKLEEDVRRNAERLRLINDSSQDLIYSYDIHSRFTSANRSLCDSMGLTEDEIIGKTHDELGFPESQCREWDLLHKQVLQSNKTVISPTSSPMPDGTVHQFEVVLNPLHDPEGNIIGIGGTTKDITIRKKAIDDLVLSEARFRSTFDQSPVGSVMVGMDRRFIRCNAAFCHFLGYREEELIGRAISDITHPDDVELGMEDLKRILNGTIDSARLQKRYLRSDGATVWGEVTISLVKDADDRPLYFLPIIRDITEQKRTEAVLLENEERFRSLYENSTIGLYRTTPAGEILLANPALLKMLGYEKFDDIITRDLNYGGYEPETIRDEFKSILDREGLVIGLEAYWRRKDGSLVYLRESAKAIRDESGAIIYYDGTVEDISERKNAEQALVESEERFRSLYENATVGLYRTTPDGTILLANPTILKMLGYKDLEELSRRNLEQGGFDPDYPRSRFKEIMEREGIVVGLESVWKRKDGTNLNIRESARAIRDGEGKILYYDGTIEDITARKTAEAALRRSNEEIRRNNERLESLVKITQYRASSIQDLLDFALNEAIVLTQSKIGYIYYYSEKDQQFTLNTWSKEVMNECRVLNPETVYALANTGCWGEAVRQRRPFMTNDYSLSDEFMKGTPEGHVPLRKFLTVPVFVGAEIVAVIGVANKEEDYNQTDIHQLTLLMDSIWKMVEREKDQQELIRAKDRAEQSDRLKSTFLANMSHEICTPMNAIVGFSGMLSEPDLEQDERTRFVEIIQSRSDDLMHLINDILDISRIESGNATVILERVKLDQVIGELESVFSERLKRVRKTDLVLRAEIPASVTPLVIDTDPYILRQVYSNLIDNAIKYTGRGEIRFGYHLPQNNRITFYVSDTGIGIAPENQALIFETFRQADMKDSHKYGGAGLGLAICRGSLVLLGGEIWVESVQGHGSTFLFSLPCKEEPGTGETPAPVKKEEMVTGMSRWERRQILLVEDEESNMEFLKTILRRTGASLVPAYNGRQVRDHYQDLSKFHLVLLDVRLPDATGWDLAREIKAIRPDLPLIAQTAYAMTTDRQKSEESGCDNYISKPIKKEVLLSIMAEYLD